MNWPVICRALGGLAGVTSILNNVGGEEIEGAVYSGVAVLWFILAALEEKA
jgi:hypothetical protein